MSTYEDFGKLIEEQYKDHPTGCGGSFEELLCYEIHIRGLTFVWLAEKWGISLTMLGELIREHCVRLAGPPKVNHNYRRQVDSKIKGEDNEIQ